MSTGFQRADPGVKLRLEPVESAVVRNLVEQLLSMIGELPDGDPGLAELGISESSEAPDDPALARLFPDGYQGDPKAAGEFRRYTEATLREGKERSAAVVLMTLPPEEGSDFDIELDTEQAQAWLRTLNDLRLALGTRLEITEDGYQQYESMDWDDPRYAMFVTYDWLTQMQDSLVHCLMG